MAGAGDVTEQGTTSSEDEIPPETGLVPHFEAPEHLQGEDREQLRTLGFTGVQIGGPPIAEVASKLSAQSIAFTAKFEPVGAFARLSAKIAYGCAVMAVGCDLSRLEDVYVLPSIPGRADDIGCGLAVHTTKSLR